MSQLVNDNSTTMPPDVKVPRNLYENYLNFLSVLYGGPTTRAQDKVRRRRRLEQKRTHEREFRAGSILAV
jgi:hypothetical protein